MEIEAIRTALVTGATGFLGSHLTAFLRQKGVPTVGIARNSTGDDVYDVDIRDRIALAKTFEEVKPDVVYHLAADRRRDPAPDVFPDLVATNVGGTANVLYAANSVGCSRVVVAGTAEEYGPIDPPFKETDREAPNNAYGATKLAATRLAIAFGEFTGLPVTVLRATVVYGPGQSTDMLVGALVEALAKGERIPMTSGNQRKDFIYVSDAVEGLVRASLAPRAAGKILNLGSGKSIPVREVAETAQRLAGRQGLLGLGELPLRQGEILDYVVDMSQTIELLDWAPRVSLIDGLRATLGAGGS